MFIASLIFLLNTPVICLEIDRAGLDISYLAWERAKDKLITKEFKGLAYGINAEFPIGKGFILYPRFEMYSRKVRIERFSSYILSVFVRYPIKRLTPSLISFASFGSGVFFWRFEVDRPYNANSQDGSNAHISASFDLDWAITERLSLRGVLGYRMVLLGFGEKENQTNCLAPSIGISYRF